MAASNQKEKALQFRRFHEGPPILVLPNAWDAASARLFEQAGARAIATTSSGVAAALGYPDGEHISREMMIEAVARITRVVDCPVTVDSEAGYGATVDEVCQTIRAVIETGAVGINIEDSRRDQAGRWRTWSARSNLSKRCANWLAQWIYPLSSTRAP